MPKRKGVAIVETLLAISIVFLSQKFVSMECSFKSRIDLICREEEGHLHARRMTTSEDELSVTESPMARSTTLASHGKSGGLMLPRTRRASITPSDAKLYAMAQARVLNALWFKANSTLK